LTARKRKRKGKKIKELKNKYEGRKKDAR